MNRAEFERAAQPHLREIQTHCYRMMGSVADAEDLLQETLVRAWQNVGSYQSRGSFRSWLYAIASNACLNALKAKRARDLPQNASAPSQPGSGPLAPSGEPIWLEPYPDSQVDPVERGPEARYSLAESVALAFVAAVQQVPPLQRAVLLLRDVMGFHAAEVAEILETSPAAANSALQRARESLAARHPAAEADGAGDWPPREDEAESALVRRYMDAWLKSDTPALVSMLREDVVFAMPPYPDWYRGAEAAAAIIGANAFSLPPGTFAARALRANGCPAVALWARGGKGGWAPFAIQVLKIAEGRVAGIDSFNDAGLFRRFGLANVP